jgi:hypothetical protein
MFKPGRLYEHNPIFANSRSQRVDGSCGVRLCRIRKLFQTIPAAVQAGILAIVGALARSEAKTPQAESRPAEIHPVR